MSEIIQNEDVAPRGKRRAKKQRVNVDMTPMVDLACLLLTFFILTTAFTKPKVMEIVLPPKIGTPPLAPGKRVITFILAEKNQVFFYIGKPDPTTGELPVMVKSNFTKSGVRKVLKERNTVLFNKIYYLNDSVAKELGIYTNDFPREKLGKRIKELKSADQFGPIVLIKASDGVSYGNMVNLLDEMAITNVARYAVTDMNYIEKKMLKDALAGRNVEDQN
jgi:biopolymer transport protein ExbD